MLIAQGPWIELMLLAAMTRFDNYSGFRTFIGQPLFVGAMIGYLTGDWEATLAAGAVLQLFWIGEHQAVGSIRPDVGAMGFTCAMILGMLETQGYDPRGWLGAYAFFWSAVAGMGGGVLTASLKPMYRHLSFHLERAGLQGNSSLYGRLIGAGVFLQLPLGILTGWVPAAIAILAWPYLAEVPFIREHSAVLFSKQALFAFGGVALARVFVDRQRIFAFAAPLIAAGAYTMILIALNRGWP